jgi:OHCU decarboxylase
LSAALERLNTLPAANAEANLLECCGSRKWTAEMIRQRPFRSEHELFAAADRTWRSLRREDWVEAFRRHPKIGERTAAQPAGSRAQTWSEQEQARAAGTPQELAVELAEANRAYAERFGYIFIVCATGKTAEEMLALLRQRLQNDPVAELRVAAEEQRQITRLRLEKLLQAEERP